MPMKIKKADFLYSAARPEQLREPGTPEIAVAGRSNVGKSSFINFVTGNGKLAKTSKEPGRTRLVNYFYINGGEFMLVDLPGYGFAKVSDEEKLKWAKLIEAYFKSPAALRHVFLLIDIRRDPSDGDVRMLNYMYHYTIPFTVILTKADKISRSQALDRRRKIASALKIGADNIIISSSYARQGKEDILTRIDEILSIDMN